MYELLCFRLNCVDTGEGTTERLEFDEEILVFGSCFASLSLSLLSDTKAPCSWTTILGKSHFFQFLDGLARELSDDKEVGNTDAGGKWHVDKTLKKESSSLMCRENAGTS